MSCEEAMVTNVISITQDKTVADALALFEEHSIRGVPVLNGGDRLVGLFTIQHVLRRLLPEAAILKDQPRLRNVDVSLDNFHGSRALVAKRLKSQKERTIGEVMIVPDTVLPDTPLREGIRLLEKYGSPIPVVEDKKTNKLVGVITSQSIIRQLNTMEEAN